MEGFFFPVKNSTMAVGGSSDGKCRLINKLDEQEKILE